MALNLDGKKAVVEEVAQFAANAHSAVAAEYRGLTVTELTELRKRREKLAFICVWSRIHWQSGL